jgi:hypothetical protein
MAKVETEAPEFKPASIKLQSQFEVDVMYDLLSSVHTKGANKIGTPMSSEAILINHLRDSLRKLDKVALGATYFKGFLTIIPEHIE